MLIRLHYLCLGVLLFIGNQTMAAEKVVHVFVALCDNATQGIVPVPAKIGNGDDPDRNLYWGCDDGLRQVFKRSKNWRLVHSEKATPPARVLERLIFKHTQKDVWLVAHAYRGAEMQSMMQDFLQAVSGGSTPEITFKEGENERHLRGPGQADFLAFIGHNRLMDFRVTFPSNQRGDKPVPVTVLCCLSHKYFTENLSSSGGQPLLMTSQFMYPGSFILHAMLEGWLGGEAPTQLRERAAASYSKNQKISQKAARGVFIVPEN
jgi:hypothetical protein